MDNNIKIFTNPEFGKIRILEINNNPWFVGKDVAISLGYSNPQKALRDHVDEEDKTVNESFTVNGTSPILISESGLYSLILSSKLPSAQRFKRWVTSEVLPSIRKHGAYVTPSKLNELLCRPESVIQMLTALSEEQKKNAELTAQNAILKPKADFADAVIATNDAIPLGTFAKILNQNGVDIGQNRFFSYLRDNDYLISRAGDLRNTPTQKAIDLELFQVDTQVISTIYGTGKLKHRVRITPKGQKYFIQKFLHSNDAVVPTLT